VLVTARPTRRGAKGGNYRAVTHKRADAVRAAAAIVDDPEDDNRRFLAPVRMNFWKEPPWLPFRIEKGRVRWEAPTAEVPDWARPGGATRERASQTKDAMQWLEVALADDDFPSSVIQRMGKDNGYSRNVLYRAAKRIGVKSVKHGMGHLGHWTWTLKGKDEGGR